VLVIVNGQPTTDVDIDKDVIAELKDRISKLERLLALAVEKIDTKQDASKLSVLTSPLFMCTVWVKPPWFFLTFFLKRLEIFSPNFTRLSYVHIYAGLQIFIPLRYL